MVDKRFPNPCLENQNWSYLLINSLKLHTVFLLYTQLENFWNNLFFVHGKLFKKCKKRLGTSHLAHMLHDFFGKYIPYNILSTDRVSWPDCFYFFETTCSMFIVIVFQFVTPKILKFTLASLSCRFPTQSKNLIQKCEYLKSEKSF